MNAITPTLDGAAPTLLEAAIAKAIAEPGSSLETLERLLLMQRESAFTTALATLQPKLPVITENGQITRPNGEISHTYAEYEDIADAVKPLLFAHGLAINFLPGSDADGVVVTGVLSHVGGHKQEAHFAIGEDPSEDMNDLQAMGSAISYAKRYLLVAMLNITSRAPWSQDNDGNGGQDPTSSALKAAIDGFDTVEELQAWKLRNEPEILQLPPRQATPVMAHYRARIATLKSEG